MNIKLKPIAESKVRQLGGDVCGVLVRTENSEVMAVSEHGRCTRLDAGVMGPVDGAQGGEWLIQMRGEYLKTRGVWERPDHRGYTNDINEAGRYSEDEAKEAERMMPEKCKAVRLPTGRAQGDAEPVHFEVLDSEGQHVDWARNEAEAKEECIEHGDWYRALYTQPQPAVPEAKIIIDRVVEELENGFVVCERCGDQEDTATLDCMTDLKRLKALLSTPTTPQADGCEWHTDGNGCWMGACGKEFWFEDGGPSDNGMKYCLSCGKPCVEVGDPDEQSGGQDNAL